MWVRVMGEDNQDQIDLRPQVERLGLSPEGNGEPWKDWEREQHWDHVQDKPEGRT